MPTRGGLSGWKSSLLLVSVLYRYTGFAEMVDTSLISSIEYARMCELVWMCGSSVACPAVGVVARKKTCLEAGRCEHVGRHVVLLRSQRFSYFWQPL